MGRLARQGGVHGPELRERVGVQAAFEEGDGHAGEVLALGEEHQARPDLPDGEGVLAVEDAARPRAALDRPGSAASTVGVKVVSPVASCMRLTRVAPTWTRPLEKTMKGFQRR